MSKKAILRKGYTADDLLDLLDFCSVMVTDIDSEHEPRQCLDAISDATWLACSLQPGNENGWDYSCGRALRQEATRLTIDSYHPYRFPLGEAVKALISRVEATP